MTANLTGPKGVIEDVSRQFGVSFGQDVDPRRFKGTTLNLQIDSPAVGRSILTIQSFDNRYERQIQRAFEVLKTRPALEIATDSSQGIGDIAPDIAKNIQQSEANEPNQFENVISSISKGIKELASTVLGDKSPAAPENKSSPDSSKKSAGISTDESNEGNKAQKNSSVKSNYAENSENWPLWQLIVSALGAIAVVALLIGLILRPKSRKLGE